MERISVGTVLRSNWITCLWCRPTWPEYRFMCVRKVREN